MRNTCFIRTTRLFGWTESCLKWTRMPWCFSVRSLPSTLPYDLLWAIYCVLHEAGAWLYYDVNFRKNHIVDLPEVASNIEENMNLANLVRGSMEDFDYMYGLQDGDAIYERVSCHCQTLILTDGPRSIRVYSPDGCETYPVQTIETVSTVGAGDNFNAGYIYAMLQGMDDQASRIEMAQRWSQDVCRQIGNNISDELVATIKKLELA